MKVRRNYVLTVNEMLGVVRYKRTASDTDLDYDSILDIWDCNFNDLKSNLKLLEMRGFIILKG